MQFVAVLQEQQVGDVRVGHQRVAVETDRELRLAGGYLRQPLGGERGIAAVAQAGRAHQHGVYQRLGQRHVADLLGEQHEVELVHAEAAVLLGHRDAGEAELGELRPQRVGAPRCGFPRRADALGRDLGHEELAHRLLEQFLVVGEAEIHVCVLPYARGMPSMRWAMILRWISLVPA